MTSQADSIVWDAQPESKLPFTDEVKQIGAACGARHGHLQRSLPSMSASDSDASSVSTLTASEDVGGLSAGTDSDDDDELSVRSMSLADSAEPRAWSTGLRHSAPETTRTLRASVSESSLPIRQPVNRAPALHKSGSELPRVPANKKPRRGNHEFAIVDAKSPEADGFELKTVVLRYPAEWHPPTEFDRSFYAERAEKETIRWLCEADLIPSDKVARLVAHMKVADFAGLSLPLGNYTQTLIYAKFLTLFLLWDDMQVEVTEEEKFAAIVEVLYGRPIPDYAHGNRYVKAWFDFATDMRTKLCASEAFMSRFTDAFVLWIDWAVKERKEYHEKRFEVRPFEYFVRQRIETSGLILAALIVELCTGFELPAEILTHPNYVKLIDLSQAMVGISNDIAGCAKDVEDDNAESRWGNLVWIHLLFDRLAGASDASLAKSFDHVTMLHDQAVAEYDVLAEQVRDWVPPAYADIADAYFRLLRYCNRGLAVWEMNAERYNRHWAVDIRANVAVRCLVD
eukprot:TRINITY_DN2937_c0_g1_i1.p1 TRINITY_DN2937_c0_g1~~TRINITY_DN2937_c0_g1_i1.p1  ORF type:complete len:541 (+),score=208.74 TRINITY_DN2937_c0_g1_i1:90-1625(+)